MTLCFFSAQYLPTVGGVERYTFNLAKRAVQAGHRVLVVTSALPGLPREETDENGIQIFRLPVWPLMNGRFPVLKPGRQLRAGLARLWAQNPDFCLINARFYLSSLYAARACSKRHIPAILVEHSTGHLPMGGGLVGLAGHCYEHLACRFLRRYCSRFYGVSQAVCRWLEHFDIRAEGTLYNAVDPAELENILANEPPFDWRQELGISPDTRLAAFVGRIIPEKGVGELIHAFQMAALPGTALVVAGDGPQLASLKASAPQGVFFAGSVPYPRVLQLYRQANLYCLPTRYAEGFPTTFLEAAACGCPILTTVTGGSGELLRDESYGLQLPPDYTVDQLAEALRQAMENPNWGRQAAQKTRQNLLEHFTWQIVTEQLLGIAHLSKGEPLC